MNTVIAAVLVVLMIASVVWGAVGIFLTLVDQYLDYRSYKTYDHVQQRMMDENMDVIVTSVKYGVGYVEMEFNIIGEECPVDKMAYLRVEKEWRFICSKNALSDFRGIDIEGIGEDDRENVESIIRECKIISIHSA